MWRLESRIGAVRMHPDAFNVIVGMNLKSFGGREVNTGV